MYIIKIFSNKAIGEFDVIKLILDQPPILIEPIVPSTKVALGSDAKIDCKIDASPPAAVTWFYGGDETPISPGDGKSVILLLISYFLVGGVGNNYQRQCRNMTGPRLDIFPGPY